MGRREDVGSVLGVWLGREQAPADGQVRGRLVRVRDQRVGRLLHAVVLKEVTHLERRVRGALAPALLHQLVAVIERHDQTFGEGVTEQQRGRVGRAREQAR
jgi:hypothetical protein